LKAKVKIEKIGSNGSSIRIEADCDTVEEVQEITKVCRGYAPRQKILGLF